MITKNRKQDLITITIAMFFVVSMFYTAFAEYNGECWVINAQTKQAVKIKNDFSIDPNALTLQGAPPQAIAVDGRDGGLWVASSAAGAVFKVLPDNSISGQITELDQPGSISVNISDGTAWVGEFSGITKISADCSSKLASVKGLKEACVSVNYKDGTVWATDSSGRVLKYNASGAQILQVPIKITEPKYVEVDPNDGSAWIADSQANLLIKVDANGKELFRISDIQFPSSPSVNPKDSTCWLSSASGMQVIKLNKQGQRLATVNGVMTPLSVATDPRDGGAWVASQVVGMVVKLDAKGNVVKQLGGFALPSKVAVGYSPK